MIMETFNLWFLKIMNMMIKLKLQRINHYNNKTFKIINKNHNNIVIVDKLMKTKIKMNYLILIQENDN